MLTMMIWRMENGRRMLTEAGGDGSAPSTAASGKHHISLQSVHCILMYGTVNTIYHSTILAPCAVLSTASYGHPVCSIF